MHYFHNLRKKNCIVNLGTLCIFDVLIVRGFEIFGINDGYRGLVEQMESISIQSRSEINERWVEQKLDHFDADNARTWKMRYYEKLHFWKTNGPIYLFISGEVPASPSFLGTGILYELGKETGGAMYLSEHRYYGKSQPVDRSHFKVEDMKFLKVIQALADNANLLRTIKDNILYMNSKVIIIGGSYAGNLAAWMRLVYPDLVDAAISSSGPVLAKADFYEYLEVIGNNYKKYGTSGCLDNLRNKFQRYESLFQTDDGIKQLKKEESICEKIDMTRPENKQLFFLAKASLIMVETQYGTIEDINNRCLDLRNTTVLSDNKKYYWSDEEMYYNYDFDKMLQEYHEPKNDWMFCWTYQTCTEFGYFETANSDDQPFTKNIPIEWYVKLCTDLFGVDFDEIRVNKGVKKTNEIYGGKTPNVTKVVFVNGELDPWSSLGVTNDFSPDVPIVYIPRSSHCRDLFSNTEGDDEDLKKARILIKDLVIKWIGAADKVSPPF